MRLGLAGGGSDVSPFSDQFGGAILNATIGLYSQATIRPREDGKIVFRAIDRNEEETFDSVEALQVMLGWYCTKVYTTGW